MRTDAQIKQDILDKLAIQNNSDKTQIGIEVKNGVVTLTGSVFSYTTKIEAIKIIEKIAGVKAIAEGIKIGFRSHLNKTDTEIANTAINAIKSNTSVPNDTVIVEVDNGWITLLGELEWAYQKNAARQIVENLPGVKGISNNINLKQSKITPQNIKKEIT